MKYLILILLKTYKSVLSPVLVSIFGHSCRFKPTCSEYAMEAVGKFGSIKGTGLAIKRLLRCHPFNFHANMYDPLPQK